MGLKPIFLTKFRQFYGFLRYNTRINEKRKVQVAFSRRVTLLALKQAVEQGCRCITSRDIARFSNQLLKKRLQKCCEKTLFLSNGSSNH